MKFSLVGSGLDKQYLIRAFAVKRLLSHWTFMWLIWWEIVLIELMRLTTVYLCELFKLKSWVFLLGNRPCESDLRFKVSSFNLDIESNIIDRQHHKSCICFWLNLDPSTNQQVLIIYFKSLLLTNLIIILSTLIKLPLQLFHCHVFNFWFTCNISNWSHLYHKLTQLNAKYGVICMWYRKYKCASTSQPTTAVGCHQSWTSSAAPPKQAAPRVAPPHSSSHHQPRSIEWGLYLTLQLILGHSYLICSGSSTSTILLYSTETKQILSF